MKMPNPITSDQYRLFSVPVWKKFGVGTALVLGELFDRYQQLKQNQKLVYKDDEFYFFYPEKKLAEFVGFTPRSVRTYVANLKAAKIVTIHKLDASTKNYYQFSEKVLKELMMEYDEKYGKTSKSEEKISPVIFKEIPEKIEEKISPIEQNHRKPISYPIIKVTKFVLTNVNTKGLLSEVPDIDEKISSWEDNPFHEIIEYAFQRNSFTNQLPTQRGEITKTLQKALIYLQEIRSGKFISKHTWDKKWWSSQKIDGVDLHSMGIDSIRNIIGRAVARYSRLFEEPYWPVNKKTLTHDFANFLYNPHTGKSWFLYCLAHRPEQVQERVKEKNIENFKSQIDLRNIKSVEECLEKFREGWSTGDLENWWRSLKYIQNWYRAKKKFLSTKNPADNWTPQFGSEELFFDRVNEFFVEWKSLSPCAIAPDAGGWERFEEWCWKEFGVKFEFKAERTPVKKAKKNGPTFEDLTEEEKKEVQELRAEIEWEILRGNRAGDSSYEATIQLAIKQIISKRQKKL